jgi:TetR/AcrR family transcriptional regulator, transcriptional repressor for nem operon
MAGRPTQFEEVEVLSAAAALFWSKGYESTSSEDLLTAMGMGKGSFYHAFGSKRALFEKVLETFNHPVLAGLKTSLEAGMPPLEAIKTLFRQMTAAPDLVKRNGCFMGNTLSELSNTDASLSAMAALRLQALELVFKNLLDQARAQGSLKNPVASPILARYLINLWNGLNITLRMYPDPVALQDLIDLQLTLID